MRPLLSIHVISFCREFQKASNLQGMTKAPCSGSFKDLVTFTATSTLPSAQGISLAPHVKFRSEYSIDRLTALSPTRSLMSISYITSIVTLGLSIFFGQAKSSRVARDPAYSLPQRGSWCTHASLQAIFIRPHQ